MTESSSIRERILAAALEQFLRRGYVAVSVREIIEPLEISKGGFYHHFRSKEELFAAVVERVTEEWRASVARVTEDSSRPVQERLRALFLSPLERKIFSYALLYESARELADGRARTHQMMEDLLARCTDLILEGQRSGEIRDFLDCEGWAFQIAATIEGGYLLATFGGIAQARERLLRSFENTWRGVRALSL
jgi:AcrR family transcriptional regulator